MKQYAVIADYSHLWHLSMRAAQSASAEYDLFKTTVANIEGKLRTMKRELDKLGIRAFDFCFAEDRPPKRKNELLPTYRNNENRTDFSEDKNRVKAHLLDNGYQKRFVWSDDNEADDVIATLVRLVTDAGQHAIIVTGDKDLWQLLGENVSVYNPIKQVMVTGADVFHSFQCFPWQIPLHKALWGDAGDCVPNVMPRMGKHLLPIVVRTDGTLADFEAKMFAERFNLNSKCWQKYTEAYRDICRNFELVKLDPECELKWQ